MIRIEHKDPNARKAAVYNKGKSLIGEVEHLLSIDRPLLRFPSSLEESYQEQISVARIKRFFRVGLIGIGVYNSFLFTDWLIFPDIFYHILFVQVAIVTPAVFIILIFMVKREIKPEIGLFVALSLVFLSIIWFYFKSHSQYSMLLIFTIPVCLAFGNVVLPLPFRLSVCFTSFCILASSSALIMRADWDRAVEPFILLVNANCALYMLVATYRMEISERRHFLLSLREIEISKELSEKNRILNEISLSDALTGLSNRRHFDGYLDQLGELSDRQESSSLLLIDIDHFKRLNDTFGHDIGDKALKIVAQCLRNNAPDDAMVARYGGEEFAVLLAHADLKAAKICGEEMRSAVEKIIAGADANSIPSPITISVGIAMTRSNIETIKTTLVKDADQALYAAKRTGRNRVVCFSDIVSSSNFISQESEEKDIGISERRLYRAIM